MTRPASLRGCIAACTLPMSGAEEDVMMTGSEVGMRLPAAKLPTLGGEMVDFAEYRGKKLLIFMWGSW